MAFNHSIFQSGLKELEIKYGLSATPWTYVSQGSLEGLITLTILEDLPEEFKKEIKHLYDICLES